MTLHEWYAAVNPVLESHGLRRIQHSRESHEKWTTYLNWCDFYDVDPVRFFMARHDAIGWRHRLPTVQNEAFLPKFRAHGDQRQAVEQEQARLRSNTIEDDRGGLTVFGEVMKRTWRNDREVCLASPETTGGYNVGSEWCRSCELVEECRRDRSK